MGMIVIVHVQFRSQGMQRAKHKCCTDICGIDGSVCLKGASADGRHCACLQALLPQVANNKTHRKPTRQHNGHP